MSRILFDAFDTSNFSGSILSTLKKIQSTGNGIVIVPITGTITTSNKKILISLLGNLILPITGNIITQNKKVLSSLSGSLQFNGNINISNKKILSSLSGSLKFIGSLNTSDKKILVLSSGSQIFNGTINTKNKKIIVFGISGGVLIGNIVSKNKKVLNLILSHTGGYNYYITIYDLVKPYHPNINYTKILFRVIQDSINIINNENPQVSKTIYRNIINSIQPVEHLYTDKTKINLQINTNLNMKDII
jgi:hypothetical protein